jgi:uncharacterized protein (TIGR02466 family)
MAEKKAQKKSQKKPSLSLAPGQSVETDDGITLAFATPILRLSLPGAEFLNKGLRRQILELQKKAPGRTISNAGGFQSDGNLFALPAPELKILRQAIEVAYRSLCRSLAPAQPELEKHKLNITGWANINRSGDFNRIHSHGGVHWSGVYYVDDGGSGSNGPDDGQLELLDPRHLSAVTPAPGFPISSRLLVQPEAGLLVLFPGWLEHWVTPYKGAGERISVGFNLMVL